MRRETAALVAVWAVAVALVWPRGEFPLHDDWIYDVSTWTFFHTGVFRFPAIGVAGVRAQVLWGALWTRLFGQSFEVLRASTMVLSLAALLFVQRTLARAGATPWLSVFGALALLFNPIFLWASCTYMSDVPYVFLSAASLYFFARGMAEERGGFIAAGCAAVIVSWFVRQNGVVNLFPPLVLLAMWRPRKWRTFAAMIVACGGVFGLLLLFKVEWLTSSPAMFKVHYHVWTESSFRLPEQISTLSHYIAFNAINCGLFFLPLTLPLALCRRRRGALVLLGAIAVLIAWRTTYLALNGYLVPYDTKVLFSDIMQGAVVFDFGVGPTTLYDTWHGYTYPFAMPHAARVLLTVITAALAALLIAAIVRGEETAERRTVLDLARLSVAFGTLMLFASGLYFDRYALDSAWAVAVALPLLVPWQRRAARVLGVGGLVVLALFSTLAVREYFAWNRARWTAYHDLRSKGIALDQIEGGAEADGFFEYAEASLSAMRRGHPQRPYIIAFNVLPGYRVIGRYPFSGFFGLRRADVLALQRISGTSG